MRLAPLKARMLHCWSVHEPNFPVLLQGYYEKECELAVQDRLQRETNDKKNDLEAYIYSLRNKLSDVLADYAPESIKGSLLQKLNDMEVGNVGRVENSMVNLKAPVTLDRPPVHHAHLPLSPTSGTILSSNVLSRGSNSRRSANATSKGKAALADSQEWLYDEGEDQTKSVYVEKLAGLRGHGEPIETRCVREVASKHT